MADELKRYPPTARRLQQLRQAGLQPASVALVVVLALLAATGLGVTVGSAGLRALQALLAHDLQTQAAQALAHEPVKMAGLLGRHLLAGALGVVMLATVLAGAALLGQAWQGGLVWASPLRRRVGLRQARVDWSSVVLALLGVLGVVILLGGLLSQLSGAADWKALLHPAQWCSLWLRHLSLLAALALLHLLCMRASFLRQARLSHSELVRESRDTRGSWLKDKLRGRRQRRGDIA